jgi:hypothetical protein
VNINLGYRQVGGAEWARNTLRIRLVALLVITPLLFSSQLSTSHAAVKAGAKCQKVGVKSVVGAKTFTCITSGKKLVWNKGVLTKKTSSGSKPQTSPKEIEEPLAPTGFDNLLERYKGIPAKIWKNSRELISSSSVSTKFEIILGPNTKFPSIAGSPILYLENASKLWSQYKQPLTTKTFVYSHTDLTWVQQKNRELQGSWHKPEDLAGNCTSPESCNSFGGAYNGLGQLFIGIPYRPYSFATLDFTRANLTHEYTHTVQYTQLNAPANVKLPCWYAEGQPQVIGHSLGFESLAEYKQSRQIWFDDPAGALGDYSPESILKFYSLTGGSTGGFCNQQVRPRVYDLGYITVEALAAVKGIESTMDLVVNIGNDATFEDSFKKVYGISWSEAAPILAKVVSAEFTR